MNKRSIYIALLPLLLLVPEKAWAETLYIDDKVLVGLHQEKSTDSAILKLIPSGTALQVIKQDNPLTQVKDPDGTTGWVDNKYLVKTAPGRAQLQAAQEKIAQLETEITNLPKVNANPSVDPNLAKENEELRQLLKSERLRIGELQAQTAELRNKLGQENNNENITEQLEKLSREKAELQQQINNLQNTSDVPAKNTNLDIGGYNWKTILIVLSISLILGFAAGIYVLDLIIRRRHGGFRV